MSIYNLHGDYINFGNVTQVKGIAAAITITFIYNSSLNNGVVCGLLNGLATDEKYWVYVDASGRPTLDYSWGTLDGIWKGPTVGAGYTGEIAFTYNNSSTSNNPSIFYNGVSQTVSRIQAPSGSAKTGTGGTWYLGDFLNLAGSGLAGTVFQDVRVYNAIISPQQLVGMWNSGHPKIEGWDNNLVFHATCLYAENRYPTTPFSGVLGNTDYFFDRINHYKGTPSIANGSTGLYDLAFGTGF